MGRSASGKTTIAKEVAKQLNLQKLKSYATRQPRQEELEHPEEADHIFISPEQVAHYNPVAYSKIGEAEYFFTENELSQADIVVIDPNGFKNLQERVSGDYKFVLIYIAVDREIGLKRASERGDDLVVWAQRYDAENGQFEDFERAIENGEVKCHVVNNNGFLDAAVNKVKEIVENENN